MYSMTRLLKGSVLLKRCLVVSLGYGLRLYLCWKALSKALTEDELVYLRAQFNLLEPKDGCVSLDNFRTALVKYSTAAMKESRVLDILDTMKPLTYTRMTFEEFCAAAISPHQLEALEGWEIIASSAFEFFELEGNRVISVDTLAQILIWWTDIMRVVC